MPSDNMVRGVTVLIPPPGRERVNFYRTLTATGAAAAARGHAVWMPALTGEGDSSDRAESPDIAQTWCEDIDEVVRAAAGSAPGAPITLVGVRLGAAVASHVQHPDVRALILWSPLSGRQHVRGQSMLRSIAMSDAKHVDNDEFVGDSFTAEQLSSLRGLKLRSQPVDDGIIVHRIEADPDPSRNPDWHPQLARIATSGVEQVVEALAEGVAREARWEPVTSTVVATLWGAVSETFVDVGPHALTGVLTEPVDPATPDERPAVLFTATGAELREGPGSVWTSTARSLAAHGVTSLRSDRRYIGDAADIRQDEAPNPYHDHAVSDLVDAHSWLLRRGHHSVTGVGLCSGAWLFLGALQHMTLERVIVINSVFWSRSASAVADAFDLSLEWSKRGLELRSETSPTAQSWRGRIAVTARAALRRRPWIRGALLCARYGSFGLPVLRSATTSTTIDLVFGQEEGAIFDALGGRLAALSASFSPATVDIHKVEGLEHSLFTKWSRDFVQDFVLTTVVGADGT